MPRRNGRVKANSAVQFDRFDLLTLNSICAEPLASLQRLAELAGISVKSLKRRLVLLKDTSVLLRVAARVNLSTVGLQLTPVLASVPFNEIESVEKACDLHPYTRYRVRCIGSSNGLFMIFGIPRGTEFQLTEFLDGLKRLSIVDEFRILRMVAEPVYKNPDFASYDPVSETWGFKIAKWTRGLSSHTAELQQFSPSNLKELDHRDLVLLRLLTEDARKPQKVLAKELHVPEYEISRRLKFILQKHIVSNYDVFLGRRLFRFAPGALFEAVCSLDTTRAVAKGLEALPFQASFMPTVDGFLLYAGLPSPLFTEIGASLLRHSEAVSVMWTDYDTSMHYYFDEAPHVEGRGEWETNRRFAIDEPLSELRRKLGR